MVRPTSTEESSNYIVLESLEYAFMCIGMGGPASLLSMPPSQSHSYALMYRLGILSDDPVEPLGSPLKILSTYLQQRLGYQRGDQDCVHLHEFIGIKWPDNKVSAEKSGFLKVIRASNLQLVKSQQFQHFFKQNFPIMLKLCSF